MTYFLDLRTANVGGSPTTPRLLQGDGVNNLDGLMFIEAASVASRVANKNLLFAVHGFNVSRGNGARTLGLLDNYLNLTDPDIFIAVLWPGDAWIPLIDYPFEGNVSIQCGKLVAGFCNTYCSRAESLSFLSHSLGARLVLEAIMHLDRAVRSVCLAAAAVNRDCLNREYAFVTNVADRISVLASAKDLVLRLAYAAGDPFADLLHDDHTPFHPALGYRGPPVPIVPPLSQPWEIPDSPAYGHSDYLPKFPPSPADEWQKPADFMKRAFLGQRQTWPPG
jgi:hypothetical protein